MRRLDPRRLPLVWYSILMALVTLPVFLLEKDVLHYPGWWITGSEYIIGAFLGFEWNLYRKFTASLRDMFWRVR